jgi:hypothetical protein
MTTPVGGAPGINEHFASDNHSAALSMGRS